MVLNAFIRPKSNIDQMFEAAVQQIKAMEDSRMEKEVEQMLIKVATSMEEEWALKEERLKRAREKEREYWEHLG